MDRETVKRRCWGKIWRSPWTWLPALAGLGLVLFGGQLIATLGGAALIALGIGSAVWRSTMGLERLTDSVLQELRKDAYEVHLEQIRSLQRRLRTYKDSRTGDAIRNLRDLYKRMYESRLLADSDGPAWQYDLRQQLAEVYKSTFESLKRSFEIWTTTEKIKSDDQRNELLASREQAVTEALGAVQQLGESVDSIEAKAIKEQIPEQELSKLREELDRGLEVARRVEQRMDELDRLSSRSRHSE